VTVNAAGASDQELVRVLERVDWNFPGATTPQRTVHSCHWFPGNFIPQIPAYLIQLLSAPGDLVADPFVGSGTTAVEAALLGRAAWVADVNRASIQVTRGKVAATLSPELHVKLRELLPNLIWEGILRSQAFGRRREGEDSELRKWCDEDTLAQLRYVWGLIEGSTGGELRSVLEMIFSDTLFACASVGGAKTSGGKRRRHHWGWVADNVKPVRPVRRDAIKFFRERVAHTADVLRRVPPALAAKVAIRHEDARSLSLQDSSVDLLLSSPPYVGMIDYALANRLTYLWHGWDLEEDRDAEIGARYRRNRRDAVEVYLEAMRTVVGEVSRILRPGGYCAIVIGASRKFPDAVRQVVGIFSASLEPVWGPQGRVPTRRRVSERRGTEPREWLCIFRK